MSFALGLGGGIGLGTILGTQPVTNGLNYLANTLIPNTIVSANDVIDMVHRGYLTKTTYYLIMKHLGYNEAYSRILYAGADSLMTSEQSALYRIERDLEIEYLFENDQITDSDRITSRANNILVYHENMKKQGYRFNDSSSFFSANRPLPTFSTILEWMAKEVFEPDAISTFRLSEEQPPALETYMSKYGVPDEEARKYWIAHWDTVGYGQWRSLYNRFNDRRDPTHVNNQLKEYKKNAAGDRLTFEDVKITDDAYRKYFTVLEQTPYFRNRLLGATSEPVNFTTLQDLYRYGILNSDEVKEFLRDYNWSDYNATLIVDAWKRKFPYGDRLPKYDNILYQYKKGIVTRAEATLSLQENGVDAETIAFQLDKISDDIDERRIEMTIKNLAQNYGRFKLSASQLITEINAITTDQTRRDFIKIEIEIAAEKYRNSPSLRQIGRSYSDRKITLEEFNAYLSNHFYTEADVTLILKVYAPDPEP